VNEFGTVFASSDDETRQLVLRLVQRYHLVRRLHTRADVAEQRSYYRETCDQFLPLTGIDPLLGDVFHTWAETYGYLARTAVDTIESVDRLAAAVHIDHVDKSGQPYVEHVRGAERIAEQNGATVEQRMAALLHDSVEDTTCTLDQLTALGVPETVVRMVDALTHRPYEDQRAYLTRLAATPDAVLVKRADIAHNQSPARLDQLDPATRERLRKKYANALAILDALQ
jgi:(p)ppGpp synthase/HD superfamily hydrolase